MKIDHIDMVESCVSFYPIGKLMSKEIKLPDRERAYKAIIARSQQLKENEGDQSKSLVVHCKKAKYDIYIGRPSIWGNPFILGKDGNREEVVQKYETWIKTQPYLLEQLPLLYGKILGCWCSPNACHGDVLVRLSKEMMENQE